MIYSRKIFDCDSSNYGVICGAILKVWTVLLWQNFNVGTSASYRGKINDGTLP